MTAELSNFLIVGAILFTLGAIGFLTRRNLIVMFLSAELMLQGVALNLVEFSRSHNNYQGQAFTIFVLTVAACEAAIALAIILILYQAKKTLDVSAWRQLRETKADPMQSQADDVVTPDELPPPAPTFPTLTPAGREPRLSKRKVPTHV
ncbi:MAG: NADH-quinone oxidoreductase subunit NuoK [Planctomycetota bacterium]